MLTWAIVWMIVKIKQQLTEGTAVLLFTALLLDAAITLYTIYMVVGLVAKGIG